MPSHAKPSSLVPALALLLAFLLPAISSAADGKPDFSGTWTFVRQRSDDLSQKVAESVGPASTASGRASCT